MIEIESWEQWGHCPEHLEKKYKISENIFATFQEEKNWKKRSFTSTYSNVSGRVNHWKLTEDKDGSLGKYLCLQEMHLDDKKDLGGVSGRKILFLDILSA